MQTFLAWRPILDPLPIDSVWYLMLIPISLGIALAYKAVRVPEIKDYPKQVIVMTIQTILAIVGLAVGAYLVIEVALPLIAPK